MVSSVTSSTTSTSSTTGTSSSNSLSTSYEMFLTLLTTQLQTQNPLDPVDSTEFTSQLATYAALEQQISTNEKLDSVLSSIESLSFSTGVGYIGMTVEAEGDTLAVDSGGAVDGGWKYTLDGDAAAVTLEITDADGTVVWSGSGDTQSGTHDFTWDGKDSDGNAVGAGEYTLKVTATDADGATVDSAISIVGTVTAVDSSSGSTVLEIGDTEIGLGDITRLAA